MWLVEIIMTISNRDVALDQLERKMPSPLPESPSEVGLILHAKK